MKLNLSIKIIIIIEIAVLVVAISSGSVALLIQKNTLEKLTNTQLQSVSVLKEYSVVQYVARSLGRVAFVASNERTRDIFTTFIQHKTEKLKQEAYTVLQESGGNKDIYVNTFVMDEQGVIIASLHPSDEGKIRSAESMFLDAKKEPTMHNFYYDAGDEEEKLIITAPIFDATGVFRGVLASEIKIGDISTIMSEKSGLGQTGESYLINSSHLVITDLLKEPGVALKKTIYLPQIESCLQGNSDYGVIADYHGDKVFAYWHWIPEIKSCLMTKEDQTEALAPMLNITVSLLSIIGIASLLIGIVGYIIGRNFVKPLGKLRDFALRIKEGNFKIESGTVSDDEIGEIMSSFNGMAEQLSNYTGDLQAAVEEQTLEINKKAEEYQELNKLMIGREVKMMELKKEIEELRQATPKKEMV